MTPRGWLRCSRCGRTAARATRIPPRRFLDPALEHKIKILEVAAGARVVGDVDDDDFAVFCPRGHYVVGNRPVE